MKRVTLLFNRFHVNLKCLSWSGDKERSFIGSKQWIGAIELGFVLDTLLGVTSKVITVRSGAEIDSKAPEIAHHFATQVSWSRHGYGLVHGDLQCCNFQSLWNRFLVVASGCIVLAKG